MYQQKGKVCTSNNYGCSKTNIIEWINDCKTENTNTSENINYYCLLQI